MFILAIMSSVVSASYYLKTIKIIMFDEPSHQNQEFSSRVIPQKTNNTDDSNN
jgi:NADH:ubiquinone oxidoreductase subunit 2 (subunit N)